jgi:hypothetical protein
MKQILVLFTSALFLFSCQNQTGSTWQTITFTEDTALLTHVNLGDSTHGHGDGMAFEAVLRDTTGIAVGELLGWVITVDVVDGDSANPVYLTEHIGTMIIKFDDENTIIAGGGTNFKKGDVLMEIEKPQKRAILGGTGKYKGIKGEVTTSRNKDGIYKHVLSVKMED